MYQVNLFQNLKSPSNPICISLEQYIEWVKNGNNQQRVLAGRLYEKGSTLYNRAKEASPCVTFNFLYKGYKSDDNIISSTGLIYYDMDSVEAIDAINKIDKRKIHVLNKSFGGIGYSLIVKASGITVNNFNESYLSIAKELGIDKLFDHNAFKKSQFTVLSYDSNIFYNYDSFVFSSSKSNKVSFSGNMSSLSSNSLRNDTIFNKQNKFRYTNASDYIKSENEYQVFPDGIDVAKINIPRNIQVGNRKNVLIAIVNQIVSLNYHLSRERVLEMAVRINEIITKEPLSYKDVLGVVSSVFKYKQDGTLKPINNKIRKVIFKEDSKLSKIEKIAISNKEIGKLRRGKTKQKIYDAIKNWNSQEKITAKELANKIQMGIATVKRSWIDFNDLIKNHNEQIKNSRISNS
jgi:hypothetical protein